MIDKSLMIANAVTRRTEKAIDLFTIDATHVRNEAFMKQMLIYHSVVARPWRYFTSSLERARNDDSSPTAIFDNKSFKHFGAFWPAQLRLVFSSNPTLPRLILPVHELTNTRLTWRLSFDIYMADKDFEERTRSTLEE